MGFEPRKKNKVYNYPFRQCPNGPGVFSINTTFQFLSKVNNTDSLGTEVRLFDSCITPLSIHFILSPLFPFQLGPGVVPSPPTNQ